MKSIVIYNPISGHGHLDSWSAIFTKVLLESDWMVLVITPDPQGLIDDLNVINCLNLNRLKAVSQNNGELKVITSENAKKTSLIGVWRKINAAGYEHVFGNEKQVAQNLIKFHEKLLTAIYLFLHFCRYFLFPLTKIRLKPNESVQNSSFLSLSDIERQVKDQKFQANVIFHMYLDDLNFHKSQAYYASSSLKFKWAGILFAPVVDDPPCFDEYQILQGVAFLDEGIANDAAKSLTNVCVRYLPDIANIQLPKELPDIAHLIKCRANGRKIIFLGGIIGLRKNLALWLDLIDRADPKKWYFVQIGEIDFKNLKSSEFFAVYKKILFSPENLMLLPSYISDESIFNSIISISDIVFAVYRDFKNSSNMITKASFFHKPILVSDRYLMGRRVQAYGIGFAVPEDNVQKIILGLEKLASENIPSAKFESYNSAFNQEVFGAKFLKFMDELNES